MAKHVIEVRDYSGGATSKTQPGTGEGPTSAKPSNEVQDAVDAGSGSREMVATTILKAVVAEATLSQISDYVGQYTTNTLAARKRGVGIAYGALVALAFKAPPVGIPALALYTVNKAVSFGIDMNLRNTRSEYLSTLAGGTVSMSGYAGMQL